MIKNLTALFVLLTVLMASNSFAANNPKNKLKSKKSELSKVSEQIKHIKQTLGNSHDQRETLYEELKQTEKSISTLSVQLRETNAQLRNEERLLKRISRKTEEQKRQLQKEQSQLTQQLRSSYQLGKHQYIKLLLSQKNPYTLSRQLTYYRYINAARVDLIKKINFTLTALMRNEEEKAKHTTELKRIKQTKNDASKALTKQQTYRQNVIATLNHKIQTGSQNLKELQKNQKALEKVISKLKRAAKNVNDGSLPFSKMRHKLAWPTKGKIIQRFGDPIDNGQIKASGVLISTPPR